MKHRYRHGHWTRHRHRQINTYNIQNIKRNMGVDRCRTLTRTRVRHQTRQGTGVSVLHSSSQPGFTKFHCIVAKCRAELNTFTNSFVSFTRRQSNQIVHYLAKASRFLNCIHRFGRVSYCVFHHITSEMKQFSLCKKIIIITSYRGGFPGLRKN